MSDGLCPDLDNHLRQTRERLVLDRLAPFASVQAEVSSSVGDALVDGFEKFFNVGAR